MVDITHKTNSLRKAIATAIVKVSQQETIDAINNKQIEIGSIKLEWKSCGKTEFKNEGSNNLKCAVIVCSDSIAAGSKQDAAGKPIMQKLEQYNVQTELYEIIADDLSLIQTKAK